MGGPPVGPDDFVLSADEKTSVQARRRKQPTLALAAARPMRVEHEYFREGAWTYLAAWDVHRAKVFGRCESKNGIGPVDRLVSEVMIQAPYRTARRVFWIMDNCSAHRGQKDADRFRSKWPNAILVHTPIHASWLNQIEIYLSIVQRKVLTPKRLPFFGPTPRAPAGFPGPLRTQRLAFQVDLHPQRSARSAGQTRPKISATGGLIQVLKIRHCNSEPEH